MEWWKFNSIPIDYDNGIENTTKGEVVVYLHFWYIFIIFVKTI